MPRILHVDPRALHLPSSRLGGADPQKLARQIARFGDSIDGMPPLWVYRGADGEFLIFDGVTRATRAAMLKPGMKIAVEIIDDRPSSYGNRPTIGDRLP